MASGADCTNHPIQITLHLAAYLEHVRTTRTLDTQVFTHLLLYMDSLTACISACERLLRTPIPLGYNIAISRIVWIFVLVLPSQLYDTLGWMTVGVTMLTAYVLFALSEVGLEIENVSFDLRYLLLSLKLIYGWMNGIAVGRRPK